MRLLDLFCGRWGWSRAFAARGWECFGYDLVEPPETPIGCRFFQCDILNMTRFVKCDFIVASSPCEQFSVHRMKNFHPYPPYPELGIKLFNHTRQICEASGMPYVMENVWAAQEFVGRAAHHCGPFYLWGSGVPPIMPQGIVKGTRMTPGNTVQKALDAGDRATVRKIRMEQQRAAGGRMEAAAKSATIPPELANCVAEYAERIIEQRTSHAERVASIYAKKSLIMTNSAKK